MRKWISVCLACILLAVGMPSVAAEGIAITLPITLNGVTYDCVVRLGGAVTSTGGTELSTGDTVCFPLEFLGGDGNWYPVRANELKGAPEDNVGTSQLAVSGGEALGGSTWNTWQDPYGDRYFLEYTVTNDTDQDVALEFCPALTQNGQTGGDSRFAGLVKGKTLPKPASVTLPIQIGGATFDCVVDLQGYLTSIGSDILPQGGTVCFPLMFLGGDGAWYPVLSHEVQKDPAQELSLEVAAAAGEDMLEQGQWKTWENGHYYVEYKVFSQEEEDRELGFSVTLKQGGAKGSAQSFQGTVKGTGKAPVPGVDPKPDPDGSSLILPIEISGRIQDCVVDLQGYLTSSGSDTLPSGGTVCFPLMFLGGDGAWYPVLSHEVQKDPAQELFLEVAVAAGEGMLGQGQWKTWENGHYYVEYKVSNPEEKDKELEFAVTLKTAKDQGEAQGFLGTVLGVGTGTEPGIEQKPEGNHIALPIRIDGQNYDCVVDLQGYLTSSGSDVLPSGGTVCFPLMFLGGDGVWYPVLAQELLIDPARELSVRAELQSTGLQLGQGQWKTWENGHYYMEYTVTNPAWEDKTLEFAVTLIRDSHMGEPQRFAGTVQGGARLPLAGVPAQANANVTVPLLLEGTQYDCIADLGDPLTSSGSDILPSGGTVCFPLMFLGGDGVWYPVLEGELLGRPDQFLQVGQSMNTETVSLGTPQWRTWPNGHWYVEYTVEGPKGADIDFTVWITQNGQSGLSKRFCGTVGSQEEPDKLPMASIKIGGNVYGCMVDFGSALTSSGSEALPSGGTVCFPLMFLGGDGVWYPVLEGELQGNPEELFQTSCVLAEGDAVLRDGVWKTWENGHYFLEYVLEGGAEEQWLTLSATLCQGELRGQVQSIRIHLGKVLAVPQIPLIPSASLRLKRLAECEEFNRLSFTLADVRYEDPWPVDFASPNTSDAILKDGSVIKADLCFMVNGSWYPVRANECNENVEELFTYEFVVKEGEECLGTPRFTTRMDTYGDIWEFEIPVKYNGESSNFSFTLSLKGLEGTEVGSVYEISGTVQDAERDFIVTKEAGIPTLETLLIDGEPRRKFFLPAVVGGALLVAACGFGAALMVKKRRRRQKEN